MFMHLKERSEPHIVPWARAFFGIFWCYSCFEFIRNDERHLGIEPTLRAGPLATAWIAVSLTWRLPEPYFLIGFLAPLLLVPVQQHVNRINALVAPGHDESPLQCMELAGSGARWPLHWADHARFGTATAWRMTKQ